MQVKGVPKAVTQRIGSVSTAYSRLRPSLRLTLVSLLLFIGTGIGASYIPPDPDPFRPELRWTDREFWTAKNFLSDLFRPSERNTFLRFPEIRVAVGSIHFTPDGEQGWAVGLAGSIFMTQDGGQSWKENRTDSRGWLSSIKFSADGKKGLVVGDEGVVLLSEDSGATWRKVESGTSSNLMDSGFTQDGSTAWVVGERGIIRKSTDGGKTWNRAGTPTTSSFSALALSADGKRIVLVGDNGTILLSTDAGETWDNRETNGTVDLQSVAFDASTQLGWAVGAAELILATKDGGVTWTKVEVPHAGSGVLQSVAVSADGQSALIVGENGTVLVTSDSGANWKRTDAHTDAYLRSASISADGSRYRAAGVRGTIVESTDKGETWLPQTSGMNGKYFAVTAASDFSRAWIGGANGELLYTTDPANGWKSARSNTRSTLFSIFFLPDKAKGWAVGYSGTIIKTEDGGVTWRPVPSGTTSSLFAIFFLPDGLTGWAAGRDTAILKTEDGGESWHPVGTAPGWPIITCIQFDGTGKNGVAVGASYVYRTEDGGRTWDPTDTGINSTSESCFITPQSFNVWVAGDDGLLRMQEAGKWHDHGDITDEGLNSVSFASDLQHGFVVGGNGLTLSTIDGGSTWVSARYNPDQELQAVTLSADGSNAIVVGSDHLIAVTEDGGKNWKRNDNTTYRRYPGPILYVAWFIILCGGLLAWLRSVRRQSVDITTIADEIASDEPVQVLWDDKLDFSRIVSGLLRFILNRDTRPPITISINGDWGSGKSSLMRMLSSEIQASGGRPIWFNVWHHQEDQLLIVPFLQQICNDAIPPLLSWPGISFRAKLGYLRALRAPVRASVLASLIAFPILFAILRFNWSDIRNALSAAGIQHVLSGLLDGMRVLADKAMDKLGLSDWTGLKQGVDSLFAPDHAVALIAVISILVAIVAILLIADGLRPFPESPAILAATITDRFKLKDAQQQSIYRRRFAQHFRDVVVALRPRPLVIFIDDLDRCNKDAVMSALEAMNYLVSNAPCFVILGIARHRIEDLVGLANSELAGEVLDTADGDSTGEIKAKLRRRQYARSYLEKLIQIDIGIPSAARKKLTAIAGSNANRVGQRSWMRRWQLHRQKVSLVLMLIAAIAACFGSLSLVPSSELTATVAAPAVAAQGPAAVGTGSSTAAAPPAPSAEPPAASTGAATVTVLVRGPSDIRSNLPWTIALIFAALGGIVYLLQARPPEIADSDAYRDAVNDWAPVITSRRATPRSIKRFGNLARYAAMMVLSEGERVSRLFPELNLFQLRRRLNSRDLRKQQEEQARSVRRDRLIVMLTAIYHAREDLFDRTPSPIFGADWKDTLDGMLRREVAEVKALDQRAAAAGTDPETLQEEIQFLGLRVRALRAIIRALGIEAGTGSWPPRGYRDMRLVKTFNHIVANARFSAGP